MKLLVIGGGRFVGRHLVDLALSAGHAVTVFNRGRSGPAPLGALALQGDRRSDLSALTTGHWDAVIDFCAYLPGEVAAMAVLLKPRVGRYCLISSVSVYASASRPNDETSPVGRIDDVDTEVVDGRSYGPLKALCEEALWREWGEARSLVLRPGLVVGPRDPTQRFTWWPARLARAVAGETLLCPGAAEVPIQCIDGRDLAQFILHAVASERGGVFNVASLADAWDWGGLIDACEAAAQLRVHRLWVDSERLLSLGVQPWKDLPLWLPPTGEMAAFMRCDTRRAHAAGLVCRPLAETAADTLAWWRALPEADRAFTQVGLTPEREAELLRA
jgi:2'-hydroxyisoflavone reductase